MVEKMLLEAQHPRLKPGVHELLLIRPHWGSSSKLRQQFTLTLHSEPAMRFWGRGA